MALARRWPQSRTRGRPGTPAEVVVQARAEDILAKIERCRRRLEQIQPGCTVRRRRKKAA
jgi:hypothetical protein